MPRFFLVSLLCFAVPAFASYNDGPKRESAVTGAFLKPAHDEFKPPYLSRLKVPAGFHVTVFAKDMGHSRTMILSPSGALYISDPAAGKIYSLAVNADGTAGEKKTLVEGIDKANGMVLRGDELYFVAVQKIYSLDLKSPGAKPKVIVDQLPSAGQHANRVIHSGPDGFLYVSLGSTCNACDSPEKDSATIQKMKFDGSERSLVARGLRDTMAFDWAPSGQLYGADNGVDWRGDDIPPEKLNLIKARGDYGWPFCWEDKRPDPNLIDSPKGTTKEEFCKTTVGPELTFTAHGAPIDLKFYSGSQFPPEYQGSAFLTMHGSWNRRHPSGYRVLRIVFENGKAKRAQDFLTGFLSAKGDSAFGRPAGLLVDKDGSLLISDDEDGVIYRVRYER